MIKAYYQNQHITLYHGDCREILPSLNIRPDACVTDPPYGETSEKWDYWPIGWMTTVSAVLPANSSLWCFGSARMFLDHREDFINWRFAQEALWLKRNGSGPTPRNRLIKIHEWAYHWYRGK
jgi:site-specific DNA-methyltransferase (adenine-specific)